MMFTNTFLYFIVPEQTATQLVILNNADIKTKIGAHCPIEPNIVLEMRDSSGKRIYSGPDSSLVSLYMYIANICVCFIANVNLKIL